MPVNIKAATLNATHLGKTVMLEGSDGSSIVGTVTHINHRDLASGPRTNVGVRLLLHHHVDIDLNDEDEVTFVDE